MAALASPTATNVILDTFRHGGPIMWPILIVAVVAVAVMLERAVWWRIESSRRDLRLREKVLMAVDNGELETATQLAASSQDSVLRVLWHGLTHHHFSLQGAMQVQAGEELERAARFLPVLDTIITLAPLLGLLGTVTGIMKAFQVVGESELAIKGVSGGISEALIATACGLAIAIASLLPFNYFQRRTSRLRFELETNATNLELMIERPEGRASAVKFSSPVEEKKARIEIIPLIDIMFFLLACFMAVSLSMIQMRGVRIALPTAQSGQPENKTDFVSITLDAAHNIYLEKEAILDPAEITPKIKALYDANHDLRIYIRADKDASHGEVVTLLDLVRAAGVQKVAFEIKAQTVTAPGMDTGTTSTASPADGTQPTSGIETAMNA